MKSSTQVLLCVVATFAFTVINAIPQTLFWSGEHLENSADVTKESWSAGFSPNFNLKRFKSIRPGLFISLNESVQNLNEAMRQSDTSEVHYHLRKMNENWNRIEWTVLQLTPEDDIFDSLEEESTFLKENRGLVESQRAVAKEFLMKAASDTSLNLAEIATKESNPHQISSLDRITALFQLQDSVKSLNEATASGNNSETQNIVDKIQNELWPKFVNLSLQYFETIKDSMPVSKLDVKLQNNARKLVANALFKAEARPCESPDDTFFGDMCVPYGNIGAPCKDDSLQLYDGPDNLGICDCKAQDTNSGPYNGLIYSNITGSCHVQNSQGPCAANEWVIVKNNLLVCEAIPAGCSSSDDGNNVYWSPDPSIPESCVQLGSTQSCGILNPHGFDLVCTPPLVQVEGLGTSGLAGPQLVPPLKPQPCTNGSYRQQNGLCQ